MRQGKQYSVTFSKDCSDKELAPYYSTSQYVSGLRRTEGFELPAVEGLFCGARPILFDTPNYRQWYEPFGIFIYEGSRQEVIEQLINIFQGPYQPVTEEEIAVAQGRFDWQRIIGGFWERCH